jgi:dTDP-glucose 4,6-dehydratase
MYNPLPELKERTMQTSRKALSVVTGGAGFLGSHLCERLLEEGHHVACVDNLLTGSFDNIEHLSNHPHFRFINADIPTHVIPWGVTHVWHLASPASPLDYARYPIETLQVGSLGTQRALDLARIHHAKFFLASTSEVYGDPAVHPQPESYWGSVNTIGPRSCYDEAKRYAEALTMAYHRTHGVDTRIVRIFNTYGERMQVDDGRAVPAFVSQALRGDDVTVFGEGSQTRSLTYVSDLIEGFIRLMQSSYSLPVNIGNPQEVTMLDLAQEIIRMTGSTSRIIHEMLPEDDPKIRRPDISRAQSLLDWSPTVSREHGLEKTIAWFRTAVSASDPNMKKAA